MVDFTFWSSTSVLFFPQDVWSQGSSEDCGRISHHTYPTHIYPTHIHSKLLGALRHRSCRKSQTTVQGSKFDLALHQCGAFIFTCLLWPRQFCVNLLSVLCMFHVKKSRTRSKDSIDAFDVFLFALRLQGMISSSGIYCVASWGTRKSDFAFSRWMQNSGDQHLLPCVHMHLRDCFICKWPSPEVSRLRVSRACFT